jgi:alpha-1,6-mannosyltransferase
VRWNAGEILRVLPLAVIVAVSFALVALAAHHESFLSPTSTAHSFPGWMAGPLSAVWPARIPSSQTLHVLVSGALALLFVAYVAAVRGARGIAPRWVIAAIIAVHVIFLLGPPLQYTDVFNYINYGRMGVVHHLNPYATLPAHEPHTDPAFAWSNWHYLRSPYGPLFTLFTYALVPIGVAGSLWVFKFLVAGCSLALLALVWRLAVRLGRSPTVAVVLVGLNPIVLVWGLGGLHTDFMMMLFTVAAFYLLLVEGPPRPPVPRSLRSEIFTREAAAGALLVAAVGIKASAIVFLPLALAVASRRRRLLAGTLCAGVVLLAASLLAFGPHLGGVKAQSTLISSEGLPNLLGMLLGLGGETAGLRELLVGVALALIVFATARTWGRPSKVMVSGCIVALAVICTLGWSPPWYVLWVLPFAALTASGRWRAAVIIYTAYALLASSPNVPDIENYLHFHPRADRLGQEHVRHFEQLAAS